MKLTKRKLNQLIREVLTEFDALRGKQRFVPPTGASRHDLTTVEGVKWELEDILEAWDSNPGTIKKYHQQIQELVNQLSPGSSGQIKLASPAETEKTGY